MNARADRAAPDVSRDTQRNALPHRRRFLAATGTLLASPLVAPGLRAQARSGAVPKTLRVAFPVAETGFDPQATSDLYSDHVQRAIFEPLYGFDYLARPYKRVPRTAAAIPVIEDGGRTWTFRVRAGIRFADDPAFGGKPRELVAADYVYSWKRLLDPRMRSPFSWYLQGKVVGADTVIAAAKGGKLDYDAPIEGLRALDRYTGRGRQARRRLRGRRGAPARLGRRHRGAR